MFKFFTPRISICFLIPTLLENSLQEAENCGNLGLYGVFLGIYRSRNVVYLSLLGLMISYFYNFLLLGLLFFLSSFGFYIKSVYDWRHIIKMNYIQNY